MAIARLRALRRYLGVIKRFQASVVNSGVLRAYRSQEILRQGFDCVCWSRNASIDEIDESRCC